MRKHKDLLSILTANKMRITPLRKFLVQFILDRKSEQLTLKTIQESIAAKVPSADRSSIYRNIEMLKKLDIIQELDIPKKGKCYQYVFERRVHHFYICKACGKLNQGNRDLFNRIESALKDIHGFAKANLSVIFYGYCSSCGRKEHVGA